MSTAEYKLRAYLRQRMLPPPLPLYAVPSPSQRRTRRKNANRAAAWQRHADQLQDRLL